jgi:hypothetical protein
LNGRLTLRDRDGSATSSLGFAQLCVTYEAGAACRPPADSRPPSRAVHPPRTTSPNRQRTVGQTSLRSALARGQARFRRRARRLRLALPRSDGPGSRLARPLPYASGCGGKVRHDPAEVLGMPVPGDPAQGNLLDVTASGHVGGDDSVPRHQRDVAERVGGPPDSEGTCRRSRVLTVAQGGTDVSPDGSRRGPACAPPAVHLGDEVEAAVGAIRVMVSGPGDGLAGVAGVVPRNLEVRHQRTGGRRRRR